MSNSKAITNVQKIVLIWLQVLMTWTYIGFYLIGPMISPHWEPGWIGLTVIVGCSFGVIYLLWSARTVRGHIATLLTTACFLALALTQFLRHI